jgi:hypothetical protein
MRTLPHFTPLILSEQGKIEDRHLALTSLMGTANIKK